VWPHPDAKTHRRNTRIPTGTTRTGHHKKGRPDFAITAYPNPADIRDRTRPDHRPSPLHPRRGPRRAWPPSLAAPQYARGLRPRAAAPDTRAPFPVWIGRAWPPMCHARPVRQARGFGLMRPTRSPMPP